MGSRSWRPNRFDIININNQNPPIPQNNQNLPIPHHNQFDDIIRQPQQPGYMSSTVSSRARQQKKVKKTKGGGRCKKTRKKSGGDLNDIKVGSIIGSRYNDNWTHTLGRGPKARQKWRVVEIEKKPMDLNGIAFVRLRPVNDKGTATGPKTDIIAFWRLRGMFDIVPETKFDIQSRTASGGRKKNTRKKKTRKKRGGSGSESKKKQKKKRKKTKKKALRRKRKRNKRTRR